MYIRSMKNSLFRRGVIIGLLFLGQLASSTLQAQNPSPTVAGFFGVLKPLLVINQDGAQGYFGERFNMGFPTGIHVYKSPRFGYSLEVAPFIGNNNGVTKVNNVLIHPGLMFRRTHNWTIYTRVALETSGRYGFTPIFSKTFYKAKFNSYYLSMPLPFRFGAGLPFAFSVGLQIGATF